MKRMLLLSFLCAVLCLATPGAALAVEEIDPPDSLISAVQRYGKCLQEGDYICAASMVPPAMVEEVGGVQSFVELMEVMFAAMKSRGVDISKTQFGKPSQVIQGDGYIAAVVPNQTPVVVQGNPGLLTGSLFALSEDDGKSWFFMDGNDDTRTQLLKVVPDILQVLKIPTPTMKLGEVVLVHKNGQWVRQQ